ncbi:MAG: L,D-transpeptidase family protein [Candidatus Nanopelagicales bacterium]
MILVQFKLVHKEALKVTGLTVAVGALGVATLQSPPAYATTNELGLVSESQAKLLIEGTDAAAEANVPALPKGAINANSSQEDITALQARLKWAAFSDEEPSGTWTTKTTDGVKKLQWKMAKKQTGKADAKAVAFLSKTATTGQLDKKCSTKGDVLCVDKTQRVVRFVSKGKVVKTFHINIGPERGDKNFGRYSATREGSFKIGDKQVNSVSSLYGYSMPFWMQFDKGIGFHFSKYFAQSGYTDASMGCVILGSRAEAKWLYQNTDQKTARVVVYSS